MGTAAAQPVLGQGSACRTDVLRRQSSRGFPSAPLGGGLRVLGWAPRNPWGSQRLVPRSPLSLFLGPLLSVSCYLSAHSAQQSQGIPNLGPSVSGEGFGTSGGTQEVKEALDKCNSACPQTSATKRHLFLPLSKRVGRRSKNQMWPRGEEGPQSWAALG